MAGALKISVTRRKTDAAVDDRVRAVGAEAEGLATLDPASSRRACRATSFIAATSTARG